MDDQNEVARLLGLPKQGQYTPLITSVAEFNRLDCAYRSLRNESHKGNGYLAGLPTNDADRVRLVQQIVIAMQVESTGQASDAFKPAAGNQAPVRTAAAEFIRSAPDFLLQLTAWKVLRAVCQAYQGQYNAPARPHPALAPETFASFSDHFNAVLTTLRTSKATCKNLFDTQTTWFHRIAMQPETELSKKNESKASNETRRNRYNQLDRRDQAAGAPIRPSRRRRGPQNPRHTSGPSPPRARAGRAGNNAPGFVAPAPQGSVPHALPPPAEQRPLEPTAPAPSRAPAPPAGHARVEPPPPHARDAVPARALPPAHPAQHARPAAPRLDLPAPCAGTAPSAAAAATPCAPAPLLPGHAQPTQRPAPCPAALRAGAPTNARAVVAARAAGPASAPPCFLSDLDLDFISRFDVGSGAASRRGRRGASPPDPVPPPH